MIRLFILLPLVTFLLWYCYLKLNGGGVKDGIQGFKILAVFNAVILAFFFFLFYITQ